MEPDWIALYAAAIATVLMLIEITRVIRNKPAVAVRIRPDMRKRVFADYSGSFSALRGNG